MANFVDRLGSRSISGQTIQRDWSADSRGVTVGLWGYLEQPGVPLRVVVSDGSRASVSPTQTVGNLQFYQVETDQLGNVRLEAESSDGGVWDYVTISFVAARPSIAEAVKAHRIVLAKASDRSLVESIADGTSPDVTLAPELVRLLLKLSEHAIVRVLSLFRRGGGPHGIIQADNTVVCRAVDIMAYGSTLVTLANADAAIAVVEELIAQFPSGTFDLGFPRPVGHHGFNAADDVFFPVTDQATAELANAGHAMMPLSKMLQPAQDRIKAAMRQSGAKFPILFPDGLDHLHVKAY